MGSRRRLTKERNEIDWFPTVDSALCTGCGICADFCPKSVFEKEAVERKKLTVVRPYECVMLCRGCMPKCPVGAISFPDPEDFKKYIYYV
ncbi:MAG: ferredoxin family protein [Spirochaetes bacterium]|nr:ferredoxin family protein [Spirochaetota bacterium]